MIDHDALYDAHLRGDGPPERCACGAEATCSRVTIFGDVASCTDCLLAEMLPDGYEVASEADECGCQGDGVCGRHGGSDAVS